MRQVMLRKRRVQHYGHLLAGHTQVWSILLYTQESKKGAWGFSRMGSENLSQNRIYRCSPLRVTKCGLFCNSSCCECCDCSKRDD